MSQANKADSTRNETVKGIQYSSAADTATQAGSKESKLFAGMSLSGDVAGAVMAAVAPYGQAEAALRANIKNRFFPIFEMGWGMSNHTDETTDLHFKTNSPYFRIGCDYNFVKNWRSGNRIFAGMRYAFSTFTYDLDGPDITDPVWGGSTPFVYKGVSSNMHWGEVVFGLEAKIWKFFHLGWSVRYKMRISQKKTSLGQAWYVPGYGKNDSHALGGTFNIIFDI